MPQIRRRAINEGIFREVNEQIEKLGAAQGQREIQIVCECSELGCAEPIVIAVGAYADARRDPRTFIVAPGHHDPTIEILIAEHDNYMLVRKMGDAADEAVITWTR